MQIDWGHARSAALPDSPIGARRAIVIDNKQDSRLSPGSALPAGITLGACTAVSAAADLEAALPWAAWSSSDPISTTADQGLATTPAPSPGHVPPLRAPLGT